AGREPVGAATGRAKQGATRPGHAAAAFRREEGLACSFVRKHLAAGLEASRPVAGIGPSPFPTGPPLLRAEACLGGGPACEEFRRRRQEAVAQQKTAKQRETCRKKCTALA